MADRVIFVCALILAGIYFYATEQLPSLEIGDPLGPKAFPRLLTVALVITAGILLLEILRAETACARAEASGERHPTLASIASSAPARSVDVPVLSGLRAARVHVATTSICWGSRLTFIVASG